MCSTLAVKRLQKFTLNMRRVTYFEYNNKSKISASSQARLVKKMSQIIVFSIDLLATEHDIRYSFKTELNKNIVLVSNN